MDLSLAVKKGEAPGVIGVGRRSFEKYILPLVTVHQMGNTKLIDRTELQEAWERYKQNPRSNKCKKVSGTVSTVRASTSSINNTSDSEFMKRLDIARARKKK